MCCVVRSVSEERSTRRPLLGEKCPWMLDAVMQYINISRIRRRGGGSQDIMRDLWMELGDEDEDGEAEKEETKDDGGARTADGVVGV